MCELPAVGDVLRLATSEERHARRARRLGAGDAVAIFDGRGGLALGELVGCDRQSGQVRIVRCSQVPRTTARIALGTALPKGERLPWLIGMATQLGLDAFYPMDWQRSAVPAPTRVPDRWQRLVIEASKQCRRAWLPDLYAATSPRAVIEQARGSGYQVVLLDARAAGLLSQPRTEGQSVLFLVGPEGGITAPEAEELQAAGAVAASLGPYVLRIETAGVAAVAIAAGQQGGQAQHDPRQ